MTPSILKRHLGTLSLVSWIAIGVVSSANAQQPPAAPPRPTPRHTGIKATLKGLITDVKHLPSRQNLLITGIGAGAALAVHPIDDNINKHFAGTGSAHSFFLPGRYMGQTYTLLGSSLTVYAVGRIKDQPKVSHLGMDLLRSVAIADGMTQAIKFSTRRDRPDHSNMRSFPSGHAAETFAIATALERHLNWKAWLPAYVFASYVASSRLHENRHFASDVVFGAAVGTIAGRTVTRHGRGTFDFGIVPIPGGVAFSAYKVKWGVGSSLVSAR
jgi:membrane-associated phospholipid phosphatase